MAQLIGLAMIAIPFALWAAWFLRMVVQDCGWRDAILGAVRAIGIAVWISVASMLITGVLP